METVQYGMMAHQVDTVIEAALVTQHCSVQLASSKLCQFAAVRSRMWMIDDNWPRGWNEPLTSSSEAKHSSLQMRTGAT